jgi:hypothetical protein
MAGIFIPTTEYLPARGSFIQTIPVLWLGSQDMLERRHACHMN